MATSVDLTLAPAMTRPPPPRVPSTPVVEVTSVALAVQPPDTLMGEPAGQVSPARPFEVTASEPNSVEMAGPPAPHALPTTEASLVPQYPSETPSPVPNAVDTSEERMCRQHLRLLVLLHRLALSPKHPPTRHPGCHRRLHRSHGH